MTPFLPVLKIALRRRAALLGALVCSLAVGALWGANIGVLYPFLEVIFRGESPGQSLARRIDESRVLIAQFDAELAGASEPAEHARLLARKQAEASQIAELERWQPHAQRWLPQTAEGTASAVVLLLFVGTLLKGMAMAIHEVLIVRVAQQTVAELRRRLFGRLLELDLADIARERSGKLTSRFTNDMNRIADGVNVVFGQAVREPLKIAACLTGAACICWRLLLVSFLAAPLGAAAVAFLNWSARKGALAGSQAASDLYARLNETLGGLAAIKLFGRERTERGRFRQTARSVGRRIERMAVHRAIIKPLAEAASVGAVCLALLAGVRLAATQETQLLGIPITDRPLTPAGLLVFFGFLAGISEPARKLSEVSVKLSQSSAAADRVYHVLRLEPSVSDAATPVALPSTVSLTFQRVRYSYGGKRMALDGIDLHLEPGELVGLAGSNGSGKSTLLSLVPRLIDPASGVVRLGGVDLRNLRLRELRRCVAVVSQTTTLFDATVAENIRFGSPDASRSAVEQAARLALAHEFIEQLEHGYDTPLGERGASLSGGQQQRLALARAILRDPRVLLLDEPASSLDGAAEEELCRALAEFARDRTTLLVSHRPELLRTANRVLLIDRGRIVDSGRHDELLRSSAMYQTLFRSSLRLSA